MITGHRFTLPVSSAGFLLFVLFSAFIRHSRGRDARTPSRRRRRTPSVAAVLSGRVSREGARPGEPRRGDVQALRCDLVTLSPAPAQGAAERYPTGGVF